MQRYDFLNIVENLKRVVNLYSRKKLISGNQDATLRCNPLQSTARENSPLPASPRVEALSS